MRRVLAGLVAALAATLCLAAPAAAEENAKGNALLYQLVDDFKVPALDNSSCGACGTGGWTPGVRYGGHFGIAYQTTRTFGPYDGEADLGDPGSVPDGEAIRLSCENSQPILTGGYRINRKTSHGTADRQVLTFRKLGVFWNSENDALDWGGFVEATGKKGWNSVTISVLCFRAYNLGPA